MPEPENVETFTVTFERWVTVQVPAHLVPPDWRPPKRLHSWPEPLYDAVMRAAESADADADVTAGVIIYHRQYQATWDTLNEGSTQ